MIAARTFAASSKKITPAVFRRDADRLRRNAGHGAEPARVGLSIAYDMLRSGQDFSSLPVYGNGAAQRGIRLYECAIGSAGAGCAGKLFQQTNGDTGCDVSAGTPSTTLHDPPACYRECVVRHEQVHATDIAPCCKKANVKYAAAKTDEDKQAVQDKFNQWMLDNVDYLECRAYAESARCGTELADKSCGTKKSAETESPAVESPEDKTEAVSLDTGNTAPPSGESTDSVAEDEVPADAGTMDNSACCSQLKNYARISAGRRDTVCGRAKKSLTACPF